MGSDSQMQTLMNHFFAGCALPSIDMQREAGDPRATFEFAGMIIVPSDTPASLGMPEMSISIINVTMH